MKDTTMRLEGITYKTGDQITCIINRTKITDAKIYINSKRESEDCCYDDIDFDNGDRFIYICNDKKDGGDCDDDRKFLGYQYVFATIVTVATGTFDRSVKNFELYKIPYVSQFYHPIPKQDNLAILVDNFISQENEKFAKAIGE